MNNLIIKNDVNIENMIYEVRGKQVMLDSDLAILYKCTNGTKDINKAVKRNIERFPDDFYFQLTRNEYYDILRFQSGTLELEQGKYSKYPPYAFTEQGISMLSGVLHTSVAITVSIDIIRTFVAMHKYISNNYLEQKYMQNMLLKHDSEIKLLQESFRKFDEKKTVNEIYFNGQIYDAYSKIIDILMSAKNEVIIIDGYTDKSTLDIIRRINVNVLLITKEKSKIKDEDLAIYNKQYHNLTIIYNETFHDRYFIIDKEIIYHCGTSINHAGSRTFSINVIQDKIVKNVLIKNVNNIILKENL